MAATKKTHPPARAMNHAEKPAVDDAARRASVVAFASNSPSHLAALVSALHAPAAFRAGATEVNLLAFSEEIERHAEFVRMGDLSVVEDLLTSQALALTAMFSELATKAAKSSDAEAKAAYYGLALRSQSQVNATLKTLIELKQPRQAVFTKNAAVHQGSGTQQVAMGVNTASRAPAHDPLPAQNKLLTKEKPNVLDAATPRRAGRSNPQMEAVGEINRATHAPREISGRE